MNLSHPLSFILTKLARGQIHLGTIHLEFWMQVFIIPVSFASQAFP